MNMPSYPEDFPSNCPPSDGTPPIDKCFRLIARGNNCKPKDFKSKYETNGNQYSLEIDACDQRAISVFSNKSDAINFIRQRPKTHLRFIATLFLSEDDGIMQHRPDPANGDSHYDWWVSASFKFNTSCIKVENSM